MIGGLAVRAVALSAAVALPSLIAGPAHAAGVGQGAWDPVVDWHNFVAVHLTVGPTGDVLMWDREQGLTSARRWNPSTGVFTSTPGLPTALFCAFQTRLPDGTLAVVGGTAYKKGNTGLDQLQLFNWSTNTWTAGAPMHTPRWYPTVVELPDGRLFVTGGMVTPGNLATVPELYDPAKGTWTELLGLVESKPAGEYPRAILAPNGKVFMVKNAAGNSAYIDVDTQTWTTVTKGPPGAKAGGMAMYDTGKLLYFAVGPGQLASYTIDLNTATPVWKKVGSLHYTHQKFSTVLLPDGRVMAIGGSSDGTANLATADMTPEIWDPATGQWSDLPNLAVPRMYHSNALLLPDGRVVAAGGGRNGSDPNFPNSQIYNPQYLLQGNRPTITGIGSTVWQPGSSVTLTVSSTQGVSSVELMGLPGVTHGIDTEQRRLTLPVTSPYNPSTGQVGVQVPTGTATAAGHYYVIALDARGVPTPARIVQLAIAPKGTMTAAAKAAAVKLATANAATAAVLARTPRVVAGVDDLDTN